MHYYRKQTTWKREQRLPRRSKYACKEFLVVRYAFEEDRKELSGTEKDFYLPIYVILTYNVTPW